MGSNWSIGNLPVINEIIKEPHGAVADPERLVSWPIPESGRNIKKRVGENLVEILIETRVKIRESVLWFFCHGVRLEYKQRKRASEELSGSGPKR